MVGVVATLCGRPRQRHLHGPETGDLMIRRGAGGGGGGGDLQYAAGNGQVMDFGFAGFTETAAH